MDSSLSGAQCFLGYAVSGLLCQFGLVQVAVGPWLLLPSEVAVQSSPRGCAARVADCFRRQSCARLPTTCRGR
eukprot:844699-Pyramimonas_sp.AAC.1